MLYLNLIKYEEFMFILPERTYLYYILLFKLLLRLTVTVLLKLKILFKFSDIS